MSPRDADPDVEMKAFLEECEYSHVRKLPTGEWAGIHRMAYTTGLFLGLERVGYKTRFCYPNMAEAVEALEAWDGQGWPPGYWIKQKPEDIPGPGGRK